ncbi:Blue copper oxidase CueO [Seminavis robusta]|uniref:Blue copper oxidase CueO n=1 Tax=Seminavis robusta TaxID=568900 RepID=A0A9N8DVA1_9STRA|nr:Blue copper oxidase CueO [Seminavis robusta]|eukprot:Sro377_g130130.1 Blue copper oxidase CueO (574) ;mRNA; r:56728-58554
MSKGSITWLTEPASVSSVNGTLHTSIYLRTATHSIAGANFTTRALNGTIPGPTLRLHPGDTLIIDFYNALQPGTDSEYRHNEYSAPDESNLHFHGLHVSGELPSDDVTMSVAPGQRYRYITKLPKDHMPGIHFLHPHRHGSTSLQVGGGAAGAIIVEDTAGIKNLLPDPISSAREFVLVVQEMNFKELDKISRKAGDITVSLVKPEIIDMSSINFDRKFYLTNGQVEPSLLVQPNEWVRLRIIHAGWLEGDLKLQIPGCEMLLIAKDGVYLPRLPRKIKQAELVNAGRADIMVRCPFDKGVNSYSLASNNQRCFLSKNRRLSILNLVQHRDNITDSAVVPPRPEVRRKPKRQKQKAPENESQENDSNMLDDLSMDSLVSGSVSMQFPEYLQDLRSALVTPGCSCTTRIRMLRYPRKEGEYFHETVQGAVVERHIQTGIHPFHQHVHPFQLIDGVSSKKDSAEYYKVGDWHDTISGKVTVRFRPTVFTGKMMVHCHILVHEDTGMMGVEYIHNATDAATCKCNEFFPKFNAAALGVVALPAILWLQWRRKARSRWMSCTTRERREPVAIEFALN